MYKVIEEDCVGCGACKSVCPSKMKYMKAIRIINMKCVLDNTYCYRCGTCVIACPTNAIQEVSDEDETNEIIIEYKELDEKEREEMEKKRQENIMRMEKERAERREKCKKIIFSIINAIKEAFKKDNTKKHKI